VREWMTDLFNAEGVELSLEEPAWGSS
jgi:hypothetical protein